MIPGSKFPTAVPEVTQITAGFADFLNSPIPVNASPRSSNIAVTDVVVPGITVSDERDSFSRYSFEKERTNEALRNPGE